MDTNDLRRIASCNTCEKQPTCSKARNLYNYHVNGCMDYAEHDVACDTDKAEEIELADEDLL
jgi:hypothetical protein